MKEVLPIFFAVMRIRYLIRFGLLTLGFALTTSGILAWQQINFDLDTLWPVAREFTAHPVYVIVFGMALIPPTLWEIFVLENRRNES
ncbi:MAG: hypothetical protein GKR90_04120 [Pseudomonadales bacterium]|nr:hypothetical protein [Pseudomonadales bacterium]